MIRGSGKNLKTVFITHAHPDHYFGLEIIRKHFPNAKVVSTADVVQEINETAAGKLAYWKPMYKDDLTDEVPVVDVLDSNELVLEGHSLPIIPIGEGESSHSNLVFVPSTQTLIAGDNLYAGVHLWLAEGRPQAWLSNLKHIASLSRVKSIIVGHSSASAEQDRSVIDANVRYINYAVAEAGRADSAESLASKIKAKYSSYKLPVIADFSAQTLKK
jgi:glyoxylase-like metal-dependent hydrolase (beta-lactamase superfamily II)